MAGYNKTLGMTLLTSGMILGAIGYVVWFLVNSYRSIRAAELALHRKRGGRV